MFDGGIHKELSKEMLKTLPRRDQKLVLQGLYDKGYSVPDISKATDISAATLYKQIDAHRGRRGGPSELLA